MSKSLEQRRAEQLQKEFEDGKYLVKCRADNLDEFRIERDAIRTIAETTDTEHLAAIAVALQDTPDLLHALSLIIERTGIGLLMDIAAGVVSKPYMIENINAFIKANPALVRQIESL